MQNYDDSPTCAIPKSWAFSVECRQIRYENRLIRNRYCVSLLLPQRFFVLLVAFLCFSRRETALLQEYSSILQDYFPLLRKYCSLALYLHPNSRQFQNFFFKYLECSDILRIFAAKDNNMRTSQEYIDIIRSHSSELNKLFGITSIRLFGSVARNEHREGSDVDIFVTMPPKFLNYIQASQYLEELLGCPVDLICDHRNLRPFFKEQIERDGINIFTAA